ncbi:hypothetical protein BAUCODRAFT_392662 [Baudoinia panamericana UAMH 10762]|uniref:RING-type domain-containing protein n=1 Tax=Baudoinia panamericana (strain UAMH 10762) TaxID=717646 RepID=M2NJ40_BAUPA|nr:uncharacterized protein BAUCODRAFT_392662 [Baudoinia panamericana UAMH 10762]EMC99130.1 hypothetical protein BAUCODRAFT_392662 [Baudoinia panamericana UAMH 10762]
MGLALLREQGVLRSTLELQHYVDFGECVEWHGRLNLRRTELGYDLKQFDEREWNMYFDDMQSEDGDGNHQYQDFPDALNTQNDVQTRPASDATITSLPKKIYADVKDIPGQNEMCLVCQTGFEDTDQVTQLPCEHVYCAEGCIQTWLKQYSNCPKCRATVPAVQQTGEKSKSSRVDSMEIDDGKDEEEVESEVDSQQDG